MRFPPRILALLVVFSSLINCRISAAWVWVEGEQAASTNIGKHPWYYGQVKKGQLSGGDFLAHFDASKPGEADYRFNAPSAGTYTLWLRANPVQSAMRYSLNDAPPVRVDFAGNQSGATNIAANNAPDLRFIAWCEIGKVVLRAGVNRIAFTMDSANSNHGAIDCFVFTNEPFIPSGVLKPDQLADAAKETAAANQGWIPWAPAADDFEENPIDLRRLNEKFAGENGFIQARGEQFVHAGNGRPVRFWAVNGPPVELNGKGLQRSARVLAKYGVNLARLHGGLFDDKTGVLNPAAVKHTVEMIEAVKAEGIYTHLSIYFPLWMKPENGPGWREGYNGKQNPFALLYFEPEFQKLYQGWWKAILTAKTSAGVPLVDEPALMGVELVNEDSFFFWTFNYANVPDPQMRKLEKSFGDWVSKKYGSFQNALTAWKGLGHARDDEKEGRLGFRALYDLFTRKTPRDRDTAAFLMETQMKFYADTVKFLRGLGYKGLITASNWTTANNDILGPLEKFSYMPGDFIDHHGYVGANHKGAEAGWSIREGHTFSNVSALRFDSETPGGAKVFSNPVMDPMYNRRPSMISEIAWNRPNRYRGEAPLFEAAYGALQDTDGIAHFAFDADRWQVKPRFFMQPWTLMAPSQMGQFPAAALIYRQGLIKTGELVADLPLKLDDALALKGAKMVQRANLDELRKTDVLAGGADTSDAGVDPLIHFVGRTNVSIDGKGGGAEVKDLSSLINRRAQIVTSSTGELRLDYGKGVLILNAPAAQGVSGNLGLAGPVDLKDVSISSDLEPGHIVVVALDGKPLAVSSRILVQAMTEDKPANFSTVPAGDRVLRITNIGQDPWLIKEIQGTIRLKRPDAARLKVTALDFNGYPVGEAGTAAELKLLPGAAYYLISPIRH
ncbi:MAG: hypothetical protein WC661_06430 [Opitutaceae bacterium]|jgi:hypothetical protein